MADEEEIKRTYIGAEVDDCIIEQIKQRYLDTKEYRNMSEFLRGIITEKLDPEKVEEQEEARFLKMLEKPHFCDRVRKCLQE